MSPVKQEAIKLIQTMPDDCTFDDIHYHLFVREQIQLALDTLHDGKNLTTDEVETRVSQWLKSFGKNVQ